MGWQDRQYNRGGDGFDNYFTSPSGILSYSFPFGTWFGVPVRLHFWLLISFGYILLNRGISPLLGIDIVLLLTALMVHEFSHRFAAGRLGGSHNEFMLWPAGGMTFPTLPPGPGAMFLGHVAGIAGNFLLAVLCNVGLYLRVGIFMPMTLNFMQVFSRPEFGIAATNNASALLIYSLLTLAIINWGLVLVNLLPYYWFDGGFLLQSILWPMLGSYQALNVTCIIGIVLAIPMAALALAGHSVFGLLIWALLFYSAYTRRKALKLGAAGEEDGMYAYAASLSNDKSSRTKRRWMQPDFQKQRNRERREQQKIDAILEKVSARGMHSLTWWEKRTLRKATERQNRDR